MKTTLISFFILISFIVKGQVSCDAIYIPSEKTLVASYNNYTPIGFYFGGYITKNFPPPYYYSRPISSFNRVGLSFINKKRSWSIMGGTFFYIENDEVFFKPDVWVKFYPLRSLLKVDRGFDFVLCINYKETLKPAIGISLPF